MTADIEIYIKGVQPRSILSWIEGDLGQLKLIDQTASNSSVYNLNLGGHVIPVVITVGIDRGRFTSVHFASSTHLPWDSDVACARTVSKALDAEVRCDPSTRVQSPLVPTEWWFVKAGTEGLVEWDTE
jgi:hypothetical protein